jgi:hypothetical protein
MAFSGVLSASNVKINVQLRWQSERLSRQDQRSESHEAGKPTELLSC